MQQIIYLDADDDIATVRERLNRTQASRVSLVVPAKLRVFQNLVNLRLLQRYAAQFGVEIILVTGDPVTRELARSVRIPVRGSLGGSSSAAGEPAGIPAAPQDRALAASPGRSPGAAPRRGARSLGAEVVALPRALGRGALRREGTASPIGRVAGYLLLLGLFLAAGAGVVLALPEATIRLTPATAAIAQTIAVRASTDYRSADLPKGQIPARLLQATIEDAAQADSTGKKQEPAQKAGGTVRFTNRSGTALTVPPGTVVRTGFGAPLRFFTTAATTVPAGGFAQVPVAAEVSGSEGNVPAYAISQVDGTLAFQVSVINDAAMTGGTEKQAMLVTAADRQQLRDSLFARLKAASVEALKGKAQPGDLVMPDQIVVKVEEESFDHEVGEVSKSFGLRMRLTASVLSVAGDSLKKLAENAVDAKIPSGAALVPGSIELGQPTDVSVEGGTVTFRAEARANTIVGVDVSQLRRDVQGQTLEQARQILSQRYRLAGEPTITLQNAWLGRMPLLGMRIRVDEVR